MVGLVTAATPQDSYDHTFGTGATGYEWWHQARPAGVADDGTVRDDWQVRVTCDTGNGGEITLTVTHEVIMRAAAAITRTHPAYVGQATVRQCRNLLWHADDADFDADSGDQLLQVAVLGEIVFG